MEYSPSEIEGKWQKMWAEQELFKATESSERPKFYVLDMFPYPSGAGLHVGHPLGYIASDIVSRYKRHRGFMVLHPMGYDSFGLPAEQYAIKTGRHPADTTRENVALQRAARCLGLFIRLVAGGTDLGSRLLSLDPMDLPQAL